MPGMDGFINFNGTLEGSIAGGGGGDVTDVKVRDSQETTFESVVNEEGVAEIDLISYVRRNELTQAIENIENSIDNVEELVDTKQNIINYSTEEQNTGIKWIDGKNIYQKTFYSTNMTSSTFILGNIENLENLVKMDGTFYRLDTWHEIDGRTETASYNNYGTNLTITPNNDLTFAVFGYSPSEIQKIIVTVLYTKEV